MTDLERAVVEAAINWRRSMGYERYDRLVDAVDALTATPEPAKPQPRQEGA